MRFGIFYELQLPRPWRLEDEHVLFKNVLEQIELADRLGFDFVWEVEHHFLEEYSHSSAPEVFLGAASQRTSNIRLGHGIVQLPVAYNHPARVAERIATLDLVSDGRVEFGTGESSSEAELGGFGVDRAQKRSQWREALDAVTRMMIEEPFSGYEGEWVRMPPRNVVPKPLQRPHPPLWVACSRRETIHLAATLGIGALSFSFVEADEARAWVDDYYATIESDSCVPAGAALNANVACVLPLMCHEDELTAIDRGLDGCHFFGYSLAHYYAFGAHRPGVTDVWAEFLENRDRFGFSRPVAAQTGQRLGAQLMEEGLGSLRGAIGTPKQVQDLVRSYESAGVDQLIFVSQAGPNKHEDVCESLELFASKVMPEFHERAEAAEKQKAKRLEHAFEAALSRRPSPPVPSPDYVMYAATQF
jgi:alkanesulfonate monooxygenase SsuD/methylene tetrahydromethanopterin reductase-like flavin-dependent oxidoreductase (luciferase family)